MDRTKLGETLWTIHLEHMRALDQIVDASHIRGENGLLLYLYHVGRPMFPGELTEKLGLTTGRIANILKVLERAALVVRTPDGSDKRRVLVALTPKGEALASEKNREAVEFHSRMMSQLDPSEARQFLDMIERMISIIDCDGPQQPT